MTSIISKFIIDEYRVSTELFNMARVSFKFSFFIAFFTLLFNFQGEFK